MQRPNFDEIEERFRSGFPRTDVMSAFLVPEVAPLFAHEMFNIPDDTPAVNLSGTAIEREMNAMMGGVDLMRNTPQEVPRFPAPAATATANDSDGSWEKVELGEDYPMAPATRDAPDASMGMPLF